jgi:multiple sugar transport system ATP-binding protein
MASLTLKNVWKKYGRVIALKGVNCEVKDGELLTILGPSGAGKTSLLQTIAGVEEIAAGQIYIEKQRVDQLPPPERDVAMVFETYALYPNKTVYQNMAFPLHSPFRKLPKNEIDQKIKEIAQLLQIDWLLDRNVSQLSGGQRQRVALGRMLVRNPKVFLMDEPIAHLDAKLRHRLRGELKNIQRKFGITTLYTTHDYREALGVGDRVIVLNQGSILQIAEPEKIFNFPKNDFVGGLVGDPPMNFFESFLSSTTSGIILRNEAFEMVLNQKMTEIINDLNVDRLKIGLRPSDILVSMAPKENFFPAEVYVVEPLGMIQILTLAQQKIKFQVKYSGSLNFEMKQRVYFGFQPDKLHYFHPTTGLNVLLKEE